MSTQVQTRSLARTLVGRASLSKDLALIGAGTALTAAAAQIQIPWQPVPFTMQTLAVALCGLTLGARRAVSAQLAYLGLGVAGLPIFAEGLGGPQVLLGPTGGFLLAFVLVAWLLGEAADRGWDRKPWKLALAMVAANVVLFTCGGLWLGTLIGFDKALAAGVLPFIPTEAIKAVMATLIMPTVWWLTKKG